MASHIYCEVRDYRLKCPDAEWDDFVKDVQDQIDALPPEEDRKKSEALEAERLHALLTSKSVWTEVGDERNQQVTLALKTNYTIAQTSLNLSETSDKVVESSIPLPKRASSTNRQSKSTKKVKNDLDKGPQISSPNKPRPGTKPTKESPIAEHIYIFSSIPGCKNDFPEYFQTMESYKVKSYLSDEIREWLRNLKTEPLNLAHKQLSIMMEKGFNDTHCHATSSVLNQFYHLVAHKPGHTLEVHNRERKYLVEQLAPLFTALEHTFGKLVFGYVEIQSDATKQVKHVVGNRSTTFNVDIVGICKFGKRNESVYCEQSGGPDSVLNNDSDHAYDDTVKVVNEAINGLRAKLLEFLDVPVDSLGEVMTFLLQVIATRITLACVKCVGKNKFVAIEMKTANIPASWEHVDEYEEVLDLIFCLEKEIEEQHKVEGMLRERRRQTKGHTGTKIRDWLSPN
ncbi:hypothetical protein HK098_007511 [Nowakowskiella sp. JEL0407]|nr:hypothetical protein HK098_007511 [Nowakowskiella sp. JEL0407]